MVREELTFGGIFFACYFEICVQLKETETNARLFVTIEYLLDGQLGLFFFVLGKMNERQRVTQEAVLNKIAFLLCRYNTRADDTIQ